MASSSRTFRAHVGERAFDVRLTPDGLTLGGEPVDYTFDRIGEGLYLLTVENRVYPLSIEAAEGGPVRVTLHGRQLEVRVQDEKALLLERYGLADDDAAAQREVKAPMPGLVLQVMIEPGQVVEKDQGLLVLEAMKMENELRAPAAGTVAKVHVAPGDAVGKNALLIEFE